MAASELEAFRDTFLARQVEAERALVLGDPEPRMELWTRRDPVTLFGAESGPCKSGWDEVSRVFRWIADAFSRREVTECEFELEVADVIGDMAYTVGYERFTGSVDGAPAQSHTVRVTHVYRREHGEWKIVHRHGDYAPADKSVSGN